LISTSNQKTLDAYERLGNAYLPLVNEKVSGSLRRWVDSALAGMPYTTRIFEIGSGNGLDAEYMEWLGYAVECSDAAQAFVEIMKQRGLNARLHNAILDPIVGSYDLIFANAVLLHFTREETILVTSKVLAALRPGGRFAFSLQKGKGEKWTNEERGAPRYYRLWGRGGVEKLLRNTGFSSWTIDEEEPGQTAEGSWMRVVAFK